MVPVTVVWAYRRTGKFAFHVLTGSLEADPRTAGIPIEFGNGVAAIAAAVQQALARGARVLVGWSFYSPDFSTLTKELLDEGPFATRLAARRAIGEFIEVWYNQERRHSSLGFRSPVQYETHVLKAG